MEKEEDNKTACQKRNQKKDPLIFLPYLAQEVIKGLWYQVMWGLFRSLFLVKIPRLAPRTCTWDLSGGLSESSSLLYFQLFIYNSLLISHWLALVS